MSRNKDGQTSHSTALKLADEMFSRYRRSLACKERGDLDQRYVRCITCGEPKDIMRLDCGHCNPRGDMRTRFDIYNTEAQCGNCNRFGNGQTIKFLAKIKERYGEERHAYIVECGETMCIKKYNTFELLEKASAYQTLSINIWEEEGIKYPWAKKRIPER